MRFHRLTVTAFGPYAGTEVIDFDSLNEAGIFLMTGKTGAGKTSLLDAVCFALYGVVPGERGVKTLRSHHAAADARPEVVLEVTLGERRLRIHRTPEWWRPKKRGDGTTREQAGAKLFDLTDGDERLVSHRIPEVGHELSTLLGMSSEQFMQVVLLPQGKFQTFLRATTDERQLVLQRLFATERFSRIEDWMHGQARDLRERSAAGERRVSHLLSALSNRSTTSLPEALSELARAAPTTLSSEALAWAEQVVATAQERAESAAARSGGATQALADLETRLARAERESGVLRRHDDARRTLTALEERADELDAARDRLDAHRRAATVAPLARSVDELARDVAEARATAAGCRRALAAHLDRDLEDLGTPARHDRQPAPRAAPARPAGVGGRRRAPAASDCRPSCRRARRLARRARPRARGPSPSPRRAGRAPHRRQEPGRRSRRPRRPGRDRAPPSRGRRVAGRRPGRARAAVRGVLAAREQAAAAHEDHLALFERRLLGMADELARQLVPGEPCTVCGSLEHPAVEVPRLRRTAAHPPPLGVTAALAAGRRRHRRRPGGVAGASHARAGARGDGARHRRRRRHRARAARAAGRGPRPPRRLATSSPPPGRPWPPPRPPRPSCPPWSRPLDRVEHEQARLTTTRESSRSGPSRARPVGRAAGRRAGRQDGRARASWWARTPRSRPPPPTSSARSPWSTPCSPRSRSSPGWRTSTRTAADQADDLAVAQGFADLSAARARPPRRRRGRARHARPRGDRPGRRRRPPHPRRTPRWSPCSTSSPTVPPRTPRPCATSATRRAPLRPRPPTCAPPPPPTPMP